MSFKTDIAKAAASFSRFVLQRILRRSGGFFPGKIALDIDKDILIDITKQFDLGTVIVTGTNGKTSVTALIANCLEFEGAQVCTNKTGANLESGVAAAILEYFPKRRHNRFGVFEVDELWVSKVLPKIESKFLLLLNIFPDQLDRFGTIETIQKSLIEALNSSPKTVLVYNSDDPNCQIVADECSNNTIPFGVAEKISNMNDNTITKCPNCEFNMNYKVHQYAQLGIYRCPSCGFNRANVKYSAKEIRLTTEQLNFKIGKVDIFTKKAAEYVCYNLTGFIALTSEFGCHPNSIQNAIKNQNTDNGRMQTFDIDGKKVMINLAKNPVGFNQNINFIRSRILSDYNGSKISVAFFANAREGDGRNTDWLYEVDFKSLANFDSIQFYYGGEACRELQRCLNNSGIIAHRIETAKDLLESSKQCSNVYIIANYTAMFPLRDELIKLSGN